MGTVEILPETTLKPITLMGKRAGICQGSDITDDKKNYQRGLDCIKSGHNRVMEYVNVEMVLDGYSARVIREWYTHIGGSPTRLQSSTRYVDYDNFDYVTPPTINNSVVKQYWYNICMHTIRYSYKQLIDAGVPKEDAAMLLPLGMTTKIVDKRNLRNLVDMSKQRMCNRAYHEYRKLFNKICKELSSYSDEWKELIDLCFHPKCEDIGKCIEKHSCGHIDKLIK